MPETSHERIGPYESWAYGLGAAYLFGSGAALESRHIAAVASLPDGCSPLHGISGPRRLKGQRLWVPTLWSGATAVDGVRFWPVILESGADPAAPGGNTGLDGLVRRLDGLAKASRPAAVRGRKARAPDETGFRLNLPMPAGTVDPDFNAGRIDRRLKKTKPAKPKVVVAVIEDGLAFAHRNLRTADGARSRVAFCWLQSAALAPQPDRRTVLFGREFLGVDIDETLKQAGGDEDLFYRLAGARTQAGGRGASIDRRGSHGAHVLDLAAGLGAGDVDEVAVIAVQLPELLTLDTSGFGKDAFILSALHYIFERTDRIAAAHDLASLPLVVNFSYGFTGGPHGGRDRLERAVRALVGQRAARQPTHLVMPAGNTFHSRLYGEISPAMLKARGGGTDTFSIPWRIQPADRTSNYLEIWLPKGATPGTLSIDVRLGGAHLAQGPWSPGTPTMFARRPLSCNGQAIGEVSIERYPIGGEGCLWRLLVALAPSEPADPSLPAGPSGLAGVTLAGIEQVLRHGPIRCRIQRDNDPFGYVRGARQSYFDDAHDVRQRPDGAPAGDENPVDAFVRREGSLNGLATHDRVSVVGGFVATSRQPSTYSAAPLPEAPDVDFSAPSDRSPALNGVAAAGTRSGAVIALDGTSVAAPRIARALALSYVARPELAKAPTVDAARVLAGRIDTAPAAPASQRRRLGRRLAAQS